MDGAGRPPGGSRVRQGARRAWRWGRPLAGAGILLLLAQRLGSGPFLAGLRKVDGTALLAATALGAATTVLSAWRWSMIAGGLGIRLPLAAAVGDYYRSLFLNAVLPGGVLGDVHRAVRHGREAGDVTRAVKAVVLERCAGQVVLMAVGVSVLVTDPALPGRASVGRGTVLTVAAATIAAGLIVAAARPLPWRRAFGPLTAALDRMPAGSRRRPAAAGWASGVRAWPADVRRGLLARDHRARILAASAAVIAGHLATFVVAARSAGVTAPLRELLPLLVLALMAMAVPVNVGGWGPREGVSAWAFGAAGLSSTQGLTVAIVYGMLALVASLPGAAVILARQLASKRSARP
ncbi:MAG TPA: lysylphosphatidylglycerol synthase transmembrane domain-containing protein [Kineosporiaceae bacterium]